jgi:hypothetical protein
MGQDEVGSESLSGSNSSAMMWRRSYCALRDGRAGEDGGLRLRFSPLGDKGARVVARILIVDCADELRLMGVERGEALAQMSGAGGGWGFAARNISSARVPPSMELM